jgi:hypothetical protein
MTQERRQAHNGMPILIIIPAFKRTPPPWKKIVGHSKSVNGPKPKYCRREETMQMSTANRRPSVPRSLGVQLTLHWTGDVF